MAFFRIIKRVLELEIILHLNVLGAANEVFDEGFFMDLENVDHGDIFESLIVDPMNHLEVVNDSMPEVRRVKFCLGTELLFRHVQSQINLLIDQFRGEWQELCKNVDTVC